MQWHYRIESRIYYLTFFLYLKTLSCHKSLATYEGHIDLLSIGIFLTGKRYSEVQDASRPSCHDKLYTDCHVILKSVANSRQAYQDFCQ